MFLQHYGLREDPFGVTPDPRFLYVSNQHREALAALDYGIKMNRGFLALIAQPGLGKTTLLYQMLNTLKSSGTANTAFLFQTQCDSRDLIGHLVSDLGLGTGNQDTFRMHQQLNEFLLREANSGRQVIIFIDEAQNLTEDVLETVRLLTNFETSRSKLLQIVLAGQPALATTLESPGLLQLRQRVFSVIRLEPLSPVEADAYITHRLAVAGCASNSLFTPEARTLLIERSKGIPRRINSLCFAALSLGCELGMDNIGEALIRNLIDEVACGDYVPALSPVHARLSTDSATARKPGLVGARTPVRNAILADGEKATPLKPVTVPKIFETAPSVLAQPKPSGPFQPAATGRPGRVLIAGALAIVLLASGFAFWSYFVNVRVPETLRMAATSPNPEIRAEAQPLSASSTAIVPDAAKTASRFVRGESTARRSDTPIRPSPATQPESHGQPPAPSPVSASPVTNSPLASAGSTAIESHTANKTATVDPPLKSAPPVTVAPAPQADTRPLAGLQHETSTATAAPRSLPESPAVQQSSQRPEIERASLRSAPAAPTAPIAASSSVVLLHSTVPEYPRIARSSRMEGTVVLRARIAVDGSVEVPERLSGNPMLAAAAIRAIRDWRYRPATSNGKPIETETQIVVRFSLPKTQ